MDISPFTPQDLPNLPAIQPEGWPDIVPEFENYILRDYCYPLKITVNNNLVAVGTAIVFGKTGWLAHVIVGPEYRSKGLGHQMVSRLVQLLKECSVETILLIATHYGYPLYVKSGFRAVSEYVYFKRNSPWKARPVDKRIESFREGRRSQILALDRKVSGEDRGALISGFINKSVVFLANGEVKGFYLPGLGEGPVVAGPNEAGLELLKVKHATIDKAALPADNKIAIKFLEQNGFERTSFKGTRMVLGREIEWVPEKVFSRIGGNFG